MSSEEDDLPPPFHYKDMGSTTNESSKVSLIDANYKSHMLQSPAKERLHFDFPSLERDESIARSYLSSNKSLVSLDSLVICFDCKALESPFGIKLYDCVKEIHSQVRKGTAMKTSSIYWSRNLSDPLIEAPVLHLLSAEEFLKHCVTEESLLNFARKLKDSGHGGRNELILFGYQELKQKFSSTYTSQEDVSKLERIKEFSLLVYTKEFIHCLWMDKIDQVASYIIHITHATDSLLRKGPRERTKLSEYGNRRRFENASKGSHNTKNTLGDIYKLILERSLGRRSKAVETITAVYPTLFHLRIAVSKYSEQAFIEELTKKSALASNIGSRSISNKIALQIYRCFQLV
ncbi:hypothetical protein GpartN1_g2519.t1 [Galdieria partita]|uniref:Uncharacterized protein n=1 Tax=Galdieria partita TaxID=83374 RepID=A0A9C7PTX0_9RHOD|nr:hypothetical protein GpartN1_g2519.t1 [Galdieria partita]